MKIALLTTDGREACQHYEKEQVGIAPAPEALLQGFAGMPGVEVHVISCMQRPMKSLDKIADNIFFHGLVVPKIGWLRTGYQGCIRAVRRKLREIRPDIVHGQGTERDCAISAVFSGYPNVVTVHGKMTVIEQLYGARIGSYTWCAARVENFTLRRTGGIICISDYVHNLVERYGVPTWLIPNALQRMFFDSPRTVEERQVPLLINIGVISTRKRQRQLLEIVTALRREGLDFETVFVGAFDSGNPYAALFQSELDAARALFGKISHIPSLGNDEFCRLFDTASAMIHFSCEESFGLVSAEALARNLYLFASDVGCIRDIAEGIPGVEIFHLDDWDGLKNSVRGWLQAQRFRYAKPGKSPEELVKRYHPVSIARAHLKVYEQIRTRPDGTPAPVPSQDHRREASGHLPGNIEDHEPPGIK